MNDRLAELKRAQAAEPHVALEISDNLSSKFHGFEFVFYGSFNL
jgi:hypothetical protein